MRNLLIIFTIVIPLLGFNFKPAATTQSSAAIEWISIEEAEKRMKNEPRKVLVDVYTNWCGWCKRMDQTTFKDPKVVDYINKNYYAVKLNAEQDGAIQFGGRTYEKTQKYHDLAIVLLQGKMSFPSVAYIDTDKKVITSVPGFQTAQDMIKIVSFIGEDFWKTTPWETYSAEYPNN